MEEAKEKYKVLNYQINPYLLKEIKKLNVSLDEFLLLLYFINVKNELDLVDISNTISLSEVEILNSYSSLLSKTLIEIKMEKENGKVCERVSLDTLYNRLVLSKPKDNIKSDIYSKFENEFARSLSPIEYETITNWLNNGVSEEMINDALKEAVLNGVTNLRYIDKIIYEWTKKKISNKEENEYEELFDYDWLGMNK